jgi:hypothetical protein
MSWLVLPLWLRACEPGFKRVAGAFRKMYVVHNLLPVGGMNRIVKARIGSECQINLNRLGCEVIDGLREQGRRDRHS